MKNILIVSISVLLSLYSALALMLGWNWFISPLSVPEIGYFHACGLSIILSMRVNVASKPQVKNFSEIAIGRFVQITSSILLMWVFSNLI